jgi:large subunit ribosomal protein L22
LDVDVDNLYVKTAIANDGPRMKRIRPAPMGRAYRYQRRLSHIAVSLAERTQSGLAQTVGEENEVAAAPAKKAAKKKSAAKKAPAKKAAAKKTAAKKAPAKKKAAK